MILRVLGTGLKFDDFSGIAWRNPNPVPHKVGGNGSVQMGSRLQPRNILAVKYKPISCKFTNFQRMHL